MIGACRRGNEQRRCGTRFILIAALRIGGDGVTECNLHCQCLLEAGGGEAAAATAHAIAAIEHLPRSIIGVDELAVAVDEHNTHVERIVRAAQCGIACRLDSAVQPHPQKGFQQWATAAQGLSLIHI